MNENLISQMTAEKRGINLWQLFCLYLLQDKLENVLDLSHQQMEQYKQQPSHAQKIAYQQRLLQEDLVTIRAQISRLSTVHTPVQSDMFSEIVHNTAYVPRMNIHPTKASQKHK